jgi:hypothetical protein
MVWCNHPDQEISEGPRSKAWCKVCYNRLEEKGAANRLTKVKLVETAEEDERYEDMQASLREYILNRCCCGCEQNALHSEHLCLHSGGKVMPGCFPKTTDADDGIPHTFLCKGCYDKAAPEDGTPNQRELRKKSKESMIEQGEKMRRTASSQTTGGMHQRG